MLFYPGNISIHLGNYPVRSLVSFKFYGYESFLGVNG